MGLANLAGDFVGGLAETLAPVLGEELGNVLGAGNNSGLAQEQQMMQQTEQEQEQMFELQQQSDAFSEKMQTMASIEARMDETVTTLAQDVR
jgi:hypothetical protein